MDDTECVRTLIRAFDTSKRSEIDAAWALAESMRGDLLAFLAEALPKIPKSAARASIMRYAGRFSRDSDVAFNMGVLATRDRSYAVRHYGCALLAYSLRTAALPVLAPLLAHQDPRTIADAKAAIDAIRRQNHNFFKDRRHTGKILWSYA